MGKILGFFESKNIDVLIIDGITCRSYKVGKSDFDGKALFIGDDAFAVDPGMVITDAKTKRRKIVLVKDAPCGVNVQQIAEALKKSKVKCSTAYGQLDYAQVEKLKEIKHTDTKLMKKVLVTKFLSNLLEPDSSIPAWLPLMIAGINVLLSLAIIVKVYGIGAKGG